MSLYNIYKITNIHNGKVYVGQTVNSLKRRFSQHCTKKQGCPYLINAISKYGRDSFVIQLLDVCDTLDQANDQEKYYIKSYKSTERQFGYNIRDGGVNGKMGEVSAETRLKLSLSHKGKKRKPFTKEHRAKISKSKMGKRRSKVVCKKLSESHMINLQEELVVKLRSSGYSIAKIAIEFGCSPTPIRRILKKHDIVFKNGEEVTRLVGSVMVDALRKSLRDVTKEIAA